MSGRAGLVASWLLIIAVAIDQETTEQRTGRSPTAHARTPLVVDGAQRIRTVDSHPGHHLCLDQLTESVISYHHCSFAREVGSFLEVGELETPPAVSAGSGIALKRVERYQHAMGMMVRRYCGGNNNADKSMCSDIQRLQRLLKTGIAKNDLSSYSLKLRSVKAAACSSGRHQTSCQALTMLVTAQPASDAFPVSKDGKSHLAQGSVHSVPQEDEEVVPATHVPHPEHNRETNTSSAIPELSSTTQEPDEHVANIIVAKDQPPEKKQDRTERDIQNAPKAKSIATPSRVSDTSSIQSTDGSFFCIKKFYDFAKRLKKFEYVECHHHGRCSHHNGHLGCQCKPGYHGNGHRCAPVECGSLEGPSNGVVECPFGTTHGESCHVTCNDGYVLRGALRRTCLASGKWNTPNQKSHCVPVSCETRPTPKHSNQECTGTKYGDTCIFRCHPGYTLQGNPLVTCLSHGNSVQGQWHGEHKGETQCVPVDCGRPHLLSEVVANCRATTFGSKCDFKCRHGRPSGETQQHCGRDGRWSAKPIVCKTEECPDPVPVFNGEITCTGRVPGSHCKLKCNEGYKLVGKANQECVKEGGNSKNAIWNQSPGACHRIRCPVLGESIPGGHAKCQGDGSGESCVFECNTGHRLTGSTSRTCEANGRWSGIKPTCTVVDCGKHAEPANGRAVCAGSKFGQKCEFSCHRGFSLVGSSTRVCQKDGFWSDDEPKCESVTCSLRDDPVNGAITCTGAGAEDTCTLRCNPGYQVRGPATIRCENNGRWTDQQHQRHQRTLLASNASVLSDDLQIKPSTNGNATHSSTRKPAPITTDHPAFAEYQKALNIMVAHYCITTDPELCTRLKALQKALKAGIASNNLTHYDDLVLDEESYFCQERNSTRCKAFTMLKKSRPFSTTVIHQTEQKHQLHPTQEITESHCERLVCPRLEAPGHGKIECTGNKFGHTCAFSCDKGYELASSTLARKCQASGRWSGSPVSCKTRDCGMPSVPRNGIRECHSTQVGGKCSFKCNPGFVLSSKTSKLRTCLPSGEWSGEIPVCQHADCGKIVGDGVVANCKYGTTFGQECTLQCEPGQEPNSKQTKCGPDGSWTPPPKCGKLKCQAPTAPRHGSVTCEGRIVGHKCKFDCDPGYQLQGSTYRTCDETGQFDGTPAKCKRVQCPALQRPVGGVMSCTSDNNSPASICKFSCRFGFKLRGSSARECSDQGQWSGNDAVCEKAKCNPPNVRQGCNIRCAKGTGFGQKCEITPRLGYQLNTDTKAVSIICKGSGGWSKTPAQCVPAHCPKLDQTNAVHHGHVICTNGDRVRSRCGLQCASNLVRTGLRIRECGLALTSHWTPGNMTCAPLTGRIQGYRGAGDNPRVFTFFSEGGSIGVRLESPAKAAEPAIMNLVSWEGPQVRDPVAKSWMIGIMSENALSFCHGTKKDHVCALKIDSNGQIHFLGAAYFHGAVDRLEEDSSSDGNMEDEPTDQSNDEPMDQSNDEPMDQSNDEPMDQSNEASEHSQTATETEIPQLYDTLLLEESETPESTSYHVRVGGQGSKVDGAHWTSDGEIGVHIESRDLYSYHDVYAEFRNLGSADSFSLGMHGDEQFSLVHGAIGASRAPAMKVSTTKDIKFEGDAVFHHPPSFFMASQREKLTLRSYTDSQKAFDNATDTKRVKSDLVPEVPVLSETALGVSGSAEPLISYHSQTGVELQIESLASQKAYVAFKNRGTSWRVTVGTDGNLYLGYKMENGEGIKALKMDRVGSVHFYGDVIFSGNQFRTYV